MKLTGKCREDFEKYFILNLYQDRIQHTAFSHRYDMLEAFYTQPQSMQYGVYVDFFDGVGIYVMSNMFSIERDIVSEFIGQVETISSIWNSIEQTRPEARTAAIEKANEIYNKQEIIKNITKPNANIL
jgi:hypothetical protein